MTALARALEALPRLAAESTRLLESLVRVNSHSANIAGVNAVGDLLVEALRPLRLALTVTPVASGLRHLHFTTARAERAPSLLLIGHHDTVFPPGEFEGFELTGDIARGPGVLDMKGGLVVIVLALRALHESGVLAELPLCFVSVGDEEAGSPTSRALLEQLAAGARAALVFEAGRAGDAIITARRGTGRALATAHGRAAHAGNARAEGRSAIWALAKFVDRVESANGTIPGSSASVGLIRGGSARNTVPARASAELDLRFSDPAGETALMQLLQEAAHQAAKAIDDTRVELEIEISRRPWARQDASAALAARYGEAQRAAGLLASEAPIIGGGSDANTVGALGLPTIDGLGPRGAGFHTHAEYVELSSLPKKAEALLRFLLNELSHNSPE